MKFSTFDSIRFDDLTHNNVSKVYGDKRIIKTNLVRVYLGRSIDKI